MRVIAIERVLILMAVALAFPACQSAIPPAHTAITQYLQTNLNDPTSYAPVRWGPAQGFTRSDSLKAVIDPILDNVDAYTTQRSFVDKALASPAFKDTTRVGTRLTHTYRAKNKMAALVLDSAAFVVYKNGQVQRLD